MVHEESLIVQVYREVNLIVVSTDSVYYATLKWNIEDGSMHVQSKKYAVILGQHIVLGDIWHHTQKITFPQYI